MERIVVVGAGLAGLRACEGLRRRGFAGELHLVGDELSEPYDRPPLSKQFLSGAWGRERVLLRRQGLEELSLVERRGPDCRAISLDLAAHEVRLASGETLTFDSLVVATGARARELPGLESCPAVHRLRTLADATALRSVIERPGVRLLVVGAGFIGMEVAATARRKGAVVSVVEPLELPLGRVLSPREATACRDLHLEEGIRFFLGSSLRLVEQANGGTVAASLTTGEELDCDAVLVGVGAAPNVGWLEGSGLEVSPSGVTCDSLLRAAPSVVVAGDLALFPYRGRLVRLEHRTNAAEQGEHVAGVLLGGDEPFETVPYVWSDQYETKIQVLGIPQPDDESLVVEGDLRSGRFVSLHGRDGRLEAVVGFSMPRAVMAVRPFLTGEATLAQAREAFS